MVYQETGGARSTLSARNAVMDTHPRTRAPEERQIAARYEASEEKSSYQSLKLLVALTV